MPTGLMTATVPQSLVEASLKKDSALFVVLPTCVDHVLLSAKHDYCQEKGHFVCACRKRNMKTVHTMAESKGSDNDADLLAFSLESSVKYLSTSSGKQTVQSQLKVNNGCKINPRGKVSQAR